MNMNITRSPDEQERDQNGSFQRESFNCALRQFKTKENQILKIQYYSKKNRQNPKYNVTISIIEHSDKQKSLNYSLESTTDKKKSKSINSSLLEYLQDFENGTIKINKQILYFDEDQQKQYQQYYFVSIFDSFQNGQDKAVLLLINLGNLQIVDLLNSILIENEQKIKQEENKSLQKRLDCYSITYISIECANKNTIKQQFCNFLQTFIFEIGGSFTLDNDLQQNSYRIPILEEQISGEIDMLYKYFIKQRIREFKPDFIVFAYEVSSKFTFESYYMQKFVGQLQKLSQNKLLIVPILTEGHIYDKYFKLVTCSIYGCCSEQQRRKVPTLHNLDFYSYNKYSNIFAAKKKNGKMSSFMKLQQATLKLRNLEANPNKYEGKLKSNYLELIIDQFTKKKVELFNKYNEPIYIDSETPYQIVYSNSFVTIFVQHAQQLYWKILQLSEIFFSCTFETLENFSYREHASFFLTDRFLFQFFGFQNNNFQTSIIEYALDSNRSKRIFKVFEEDIQKIQLKPIINFSVVQHKSGFYSLVGGSIKESQEYVGQIIMVQLLYQESSARVSRYYKQQFNQQGCFFRSIKQYDNPLLLNDNEGKFLFFETETQYYNLPLDPKIYQITFMVGSGAKHIIQSMEVENIQQFQEKCYLFKSNQMNYRTTKIKKNNKKYTQFDILVQEYLLESLSLQKDRYSDINFINTFGKLPLIKTYHYQIMMENQKASIGCTFQTSIMDDFIKESKLQWKCLYQHVFVCDFQYLSELHDQEIFHYDIQQHQYLLYFTENQIKVNRLFIFEYQAVNKTTYDDFDESILVNNQNEIIWIVRKKYNDDNSEDLILYESDWINLQAVKNAEEGTTTKIPITERFTLKNVEYGTQIIGIEINDQQNLLLIVTTTTIYKFDLQELLKSKWENVMKFQTNTWNKVKPKCEILEQQTINIDYNITQPAIVKCLDKGETLFFYLYGDTIHLDKNEYEVKFKGFRWDNQSMQESIERIKFNADSSVAMAKLCSIEVEQQYMALGIVVQLENNTIVRVSHNTLSKNQQTISATLGTRVLHNAGHNKNKVLTYTLEKQQII